MSRSKSARLGADPVHCPRLSDSALAACPTADLNRDCRVDLADLAEFGRAWLLSNCQKPSCLADLSGDQAVLQLDLLVLADQWLRDDNRPRPHQMARPRLPSRSGSTNTRSMLTRIPTDRIPPRRRSDPDHPFPRRPLFHHDIAKIWQTGTLWTSPLRHEQSPIGHRKSFCPARPLSFGNLSITGVPTNNSNHPRANKWLGFIVEVGLFASMPPATPAVSRK